MKISFTSGPWVVAGKRKTSVWSANGDIQVCKTASISLSLEGNRANAALIASAPDLLKVLQDVATIPALQDTPVMTRIIAVIANATGAA